MSLLPRNVNVSSRGEHPSATDAERAQAPSALPSWRTTPGVYRITPHHRAGTSGGGRPPANACGDKGPPPVFNRELELPHATPVEEEKVYHGTPLEPLPPLWQHKRVRLLVAVFCVVALALSIGLGRSLSVAYRAAEAKKLVLRSSPPPTSSLPSSRPPMPVAPFTTCSETQFQVCYPKVAMHGDTAMVTRSYLDVQFFDTSNSSFELVTRIQIDFYPESVALDGDTAVIASRDFRLAENTFEDAGPDDVYVYERDRHGIWRQAAQFRPGGLSQTGFGLLVAIDGDIIVLGIPQRLDFFKSIIDRPVLGERLSGHVYVYRRNGTAWTEEAKLTPPGNASAKFFSGYVSVRGTSIAVGDYYYGSEDEGAVFVYEFNPLSNSWNPVGGALVNSDCVVHFGSIVKFTNNDGLVVKCGNDNSDVNTVYYYEKHGVGEDYVLQQSIVLEEVGSMAVDGKVMVVSEYRADRSLVIHGFKLKKDAWEEVATIEEPIFDLGFFGRHIALLGNSILIASWENVYLVQDYFNS